MFSATGNLLPGSYERPDILLLAQVEPGRIKVSAQVCTLNKRGYKPVVSTLTGLGRFLLGIVHTIVHLVSAIFDRKNRTQHLQEATLGAKNIARGIVEMIPVAGNIAMYITDGWRTHKLSANIDKEWVKGNITATGNAKTCILFAYGKELGRKTLDEFERTLRALNKEMTLADGINAIVSPNTVVFS